VNDLLRAFDRGGEDGRSPSGFVAKKSTALQKELQGVLQELETRCHQYLDLYTFFTPRSVRILVKTQKLHEDGWSLTALQGFALENFCDIVFSYCSP
jgi:hypothetical protein